MYLIHAHQGHNYIYFCYLLGYISVCILKMVSLTKAQSSSCKYLDTDKHV